VAGIIGLVPSPAIIGLIIGLFLLALIPTRRLFLAGSPGWVLTAYFLGLLVLAVVTIQLRGVRFLIPVVLVAYVWPLLASPESLSRLIDRLFGTRPSRGPMRNVTPVQGRVHPAPTPLLDPGEPEQASGDPTVGPSPREEHSSGER